MPAYKRIIKDRFDIAVKEPGQIIKAEFEIDSSAKLVFGIDVSSDREDLMYHRGTQKIAINDFEVYPENFESKKLMTGLDVKANDKIIPIGEMEPGNRKVELVYTDTPHSKTIFEPYRVTLYVYSSTSYDTKDYDEEKKKEKSSNP